MIALRSIRYVCRVRSAFGSLGSNRLCEWKFSSMASAKPRIQLILDFDGTITTSDTTAVIGSKLLSNGHSPHSMQHFSDLYMQEYRQWQKSFVWPHGERKTVDDEVSYLSQSRVLEQNSFLRVREGIMKGSDEMVRMENDEATRNDFMRNIGRQAVRSGEVVMRDASSLEKVIKRVEEEGSIWGIVSVSWSRQFILGVLLEANLVSESELDAVAKRTKCNEILAPLKYLDEQNLDIICTAADKNGAMDSLLAQWQLSRRADGHQDQSALIKIYIGDSSTDMGCLVNAGIGMYISDKENMEEDGVVQTLQRLGVDCLTIDDQRQATPPQFVYVIKSFDELYQWIAKQG